MGTGDVPSSGPADDPYPAANELCVFDGNTFGPRPATREEYVAWPPPGYVPYQVVGPRWSFAYGCSTTTATEYSTPVIPRSPTEGLRETSPSWATGRGMAAARWVYSAKAS